MNAGPVSTGARRACLSLAVAGAVLLISGVLLAAASGILAGGQSRGWRPVTLIALGLIVCGLFCGAVLVAVAVPGGRRASGPTGRWVSLVAADPGGAERPRRMARPAPSARLVPLPAPEPGPAQEGWPVPSPPPPAQGGWPAAGAQPAEGGWPAAGAPGEARPAPEEEWMRALRPDGPPPVRRFPGRPGGDQS